jgi:hypothetical protein
LPVLAKIVEAAKRKILSVDHLEGGIERVLQLSPIIKSADGTERFQIAFVGGVPQAER